MEIVDKPAFLMRDFYPIRGIQMIRKFIIIWLCLATVSVPIQCLAGSSEVTDSSYWTKLVHEENSIAASILYLPYIAFLIPYRIIDGIISPKPTTQGQYPLQRIKYHINKIQKCCVGSPWPE